MCASEPPSRISPSANTPPPPQPHALTIGAACDRPDRRSLVSHYSSSSSSPSSILPSKSSSSIAAAAEASARLRRRAHHRAKECKAFEMDAGAGVLMISAVSSRARTRVITMSVPPLQPATAARGLPTHGVGYSGTATGELHFGAAHTHTHVVHNRWLRRRPRVRYMMCRERESEKKSSRRARCIARWGHETQRSMKRAPSLSLYLFDG